MAAVWVHSGGRFTFDPEPDFLESAEEAIGQLRAVSSIEVVGARIVELDQVAEHEDQHRMLAHIEPGSAPNTQLPDPARAL